MLLSCIGLLMGQDNRKAQHPQKWHGENLLGFALMMTKEQLVKPPQ